MFRVLIKVVDRQVGYTDYDTEEDAQAAIDYYCSCGCLGGLVTEIIEV